MPKSILDAIKLGLWDFEPPEVGYSQFSATDAMPGTREKLDALARRLELGLPLWHCDDRSEVDAAPRGGTERCGTASPGRVDAAPRARPRPR